MTTRTCLAVLAGIALLIGAGCASSYTSSQTRWSRDLCRGHLNEYLDIRLSYDVVKDRDELSPPREYEQLMLRVAPRDDHRVRVALKTVDLDPGVPRGQLRFNNVQARTDGTGARVWFIDMDTGRILATLDRRNGVTTGPDDPPPPWATADSGVILKTTSD
jgi:hypothetical protein